MTEFLSEAAKDAAALEQETLSPVAPQFLIVDLKKGKPRVDYRSFRDLLHFLGFRKIMQGTECEYLQVRGNIVRQVSKAYIKEVVENYILNEMPLPENSEVIGHNEETYLSFIMRQSSTLFGKDLLEYLRDLEKPFLRDTKEKTYFFFQDLILAVVKDTDLCPSSSYKDADGFVWENQVLPHRYDVRRSPKESEFSKFIDNISNNEPARIEAMKSAIGYLLNRHKDPQQAKAVVLVDEEIPEFPDQANGGTGKSLILTAIGKCRKIAFENARTWRSDDKFSFQKIDLDTNVFVLDDTRKRFPFTSLYSVITNDFQVEKKGKQAFTIPFSDSPKIAVTSNFSIEVNGTSDARRMYQLEIAPFYSERVRQGIANPVASAHNNKAFFEGWDANEWMNFYHFMMQCSRVFLYKGLVKAKQINAEKRRLLDATSYEFVEWCDSELRFDVEYNQTALFGEFKSYCDSAPKFSRTFMGWIKLYALHKGYSLIQRKSNGKRLVTIKQGT